jgi:hypothetical protein
MLKKSLLIALSISFLASSAEAALLSEVDGKVLVNKGRGFKKVAKPTKLKPGDRVFVRGEGTARVTYGLNCEEVIGANQGFVVPRGGSCQQGAGLSDSDKFILGGAAIGGVFLATKGSGQGHDHPASP